MTSRQANSVAAEPAEPAAPADAVGQEQAYVDMLYRLLDQARERTEQALTQTHGSGGAGGTFQARVEREVTAAEQSRRLAQLNAVERGLVFGRTDARPTTPKTIPTNRHEPVTLYIGRIGLRDDEHEPRLIDWRAPAAHPFYAATPKDPVGLIRRRHIYTRDRTVTGVDDEVFDLDRLSEPDRQSLSGEAMLIASITVGRTGRMHDVVATIQAEQDRVIRAALQGVLVVQGGPGTGKTVAALHRAAYLLYTHRRTLERRGVLVIGPNATFLRYISQVLPSLGETDVVLTSMAELFPGVTAAPDDDPAAAEVKGDPKMVSVLRRAVRDRQQVPPGRPGDHRRRRADDRAPGGRAAGPGPRPGAAQAAQRGPQAVRHRGARRARDRRSRRPGPPPRPRRPALHPRPAVGRTPGPRRARRAVAVPDPATAGRRAAGLRRCPPQRRSGSFFCRTERGPPPRGPRRVDRGGRAAAGRGRPAARHRRQRGQAQAPRRRAGTPGRGTVRPGGPGDHRRGRGRFRGCRHPCGLEPRARPAAHHRRTRLGRPLVGLRPRDRGRGAGAVRDGLADGDAAHPHPLADRGRRRGPARQRGGRPLLGADARPVRPRPLARGAPHGQLPDPGRDHGRGRRRARLGRPRRAAPRVGPRGKRRPARRRRPRPGSPGGGGRTRRDGRTAAG